MCICILNMILIVLCCCPSLPEGGAVHPVLCFFSMFSFRWWLVIGRETDGAYFKMAPAQAGFTPSGLPVLKILLGSESHFIKPVRDTGN